EESFRLSLALRRFFSPMHLSEYKHDPARLQAMLGTDRLRHSHLKEESPSLMCGSSRGSPSDSSCATRAPISIPTAPLSFLTLTRKTRARRCCRAVRGKWMK